MLLNGGHGLTVHALRPLVPSAVPTFAKTVIVQNYPVEHRNLTSLSAFYGASGTTISDFDCDIRFSSSSVENG